MIDLHLPCLVPVLDAKPDICGKGFTFLLRQGCHNRHENLALCVQGVDVLFLKENRDVEILEFAGVFEAINCVSGEAG